MGNVEIDAPSLDGRKTFYLKRGESCRKVVELIVGEDAALQPRCLHLTVHTHSGKMVDLMIPYNGGTEAEVFINGELV